METINDVLSKMKNLYFKLGLTLDEFDDFQIIREKLIDEFLIDIENLCELLDLLDNIHINFIREETDSNKDFINEFRQLKFKLISNETKKENN